MARVFVALGSNLERERNLVQAVAVLAEAFGSPRLSPVYRNPAVGFAGEDFYNLVAELRVEVTPHVLVDRLRAIERRLGRGPGQGRRFAPRTLDLDLLLYDDLLVNTGKLLLPHPDIERYAFVLYPLAQLVGDLCHPVVGSSYARMWRDFKGVRPLMRRVLLAWSGSPQSF